MSEREKEKGERVAIPLDPSAGRKNAQSYNIVSRTCPIIIGNNRSVLSRGVLQLFVHINGPKIDPR